MSLDNSNPERRTTLHVSEQLQERASTQTTVLGAWQFGERFEIPDDAPIPDHDEARFDPRSDIVVFRRDTHLTTAYGLSPEHLTNVYGIAVAAAVDEAFRTSYRARIDPRNLEVINR